MPNELTPQSNVPEKLRKLFLTPSQAGPPWNYRVDESSTPYIKQSYRVGGAQVWTNFSTSADQTSTLETITTRGILLLWQHTAAMVTNGGGSVSGSTTFRIQIERGGVSIFEVRLAFITAAGNLTDSGPCNIVLEKGDVVKSIVSIGTWTNIGARHSVNLIIQPFA